MKEYFKNRICTLAEQICILNSNEFYFFFDKTAFSVPTTIHSQSFPLIKTKFLRKSLKCHPNIDQFLDKHRLNIFNASHIHVFTYLYIHVHIFTSHIHVFMYSYIHVYIFTSHIHVFMYS